MPAVRRAGSYPSRIADARSSDVKSDHRSGVVSVLLGEGRRVGLRPRVLTRDQAFLEPPHRRRIARVLQRADGPDELRAAEPEGVGPGHGRGARSAVPLARAEPAIGGARGVVRDAEGVQHEDPGAVRRGVPGAHADHAREGVEDLGVLRGGEPRAVVGRERGDARGVVGGGGGGARGVGEVRGGEGTRGGGVRDGGARGVAHREDAERAGREGGGARGRARE